MPSGDGPHVAIVGAGLAGAATAWFVRTHRSDVSVTVFERADRVGGTCATVDLAGMPVEAGAPWAHSDDATLLALARRVGVGSHAMAVPGPELGILDGRVLRWQSGRGAVARRAWLWSRYRTSVTGVRDLARRVSSALDSLRDAQETGHGWRDTVQALTAGGVRDLAGQPLSELLADGGVGEDMRDELVAGLVLAATGQRDVPALHGGHVVTRSGLFGGRRLRLEGGTAHLCARLLRRAGADVRLGSAVLAVEPAPAGRVAVRTHAGGLEEFDLAVLATAPGGAELLGPGDENRARPGTRLRHETLVAGRLRPRALAQVDDARVPQRVLAPHGGTTGFELLERHGELGTAGTVYRLLSGEPLDDRTLDDLFDERAQVRRLVWPSVLPDQEPGRRHFRPAEGVYDASALSGLLGSLEGQAIAARNVALLVAPQLRSTTDR